MTKKTILVVGGGIGGLTAAIALRRKGFAVTLIEKEAQWPASGVGIIQQFNVLRAMAELEVLEDYLAQSYGFDKTSFFGPQGEAITSFTAPRLAGEQFPSNVGIRRSSLQNILASKAQELGTVTRLGTTVESWVESADGIQVTFNDGTREDFYVMVGADGVFLKLVKPSSPMHPSPVIPGNGYGATTCPDRPK